MRSATTSKLALAALLVSCCCVASPAQSQRGMAPADTLRVASVGDPQVSPDGGWIVYTVSTTEGDGARTALWLAR
ncbi:MAG TPA: hypothetical protein VIP46_11640, partial [Pyrinomonadaceae bacterium]